MTTIDERTEHGMLGPPEANADALSVIDPIAEHRAAVAKMRRRRRRLMLIGIPFALLALLLAAKFASMTIIANRTVAAYAAADSETALNSAQQQKFLNLFERWKAPYNTGTVYLQLGLNPEARIELEAALALASGADQCPIRSNLAIAIERVGDAALESGDQATARTSYEEALAIIAEAPEECGDSTSAKPLDETEERLEQKLNPPQGGEGGEGDPGDNQGGTGTADPDAIDELGNQLENNGNDRDNQLGEEGNENAGGSGTDKPW